MSKIQFWHSKNISNFYFSGQFIIEFIGEVITSDAMQNRKELYAKKPGHKKTYYLGLKNGFYIDASSHGNSSRFINQSDSPNSELQTVF